MIFEIAILVMVVSVSIYIIISDMMFHHKINKTDKHFNEFIERFKEKYVNKNETRH